MEMITGEQASWAFWVIYMTWLAYHHNYSTVSSGDVRWRCITTLILHNLTRLLFVSSLNQHFKSRILWRTCCFVFISCILYYCCLFASHFHHASRKNLMSDNISHAFSHQVLGIHKKKKKKKNERKKQLLYLSPLHSNMLSVQFKLYTTSTSGSLEWLSGCQMSLPVFPQKAITWSGLSTLWNPLHILVSLLNPRELSDSGRVRIGRTDTGLKSKIRLRAGESIR